MLRAVLFLAGCSSWQETQLYFGLARPEGAVSAAEWQKFLDEEATPRLPAGFTIVEAAGQWRNREGALIREPSRILVVLHPSTRQLDRAIDELRGVYRARFHQEAVLRADSWSRVKLQGP